MRLLPVLLALSVFTACKSTTPLSGSEKESQTSRVASSSEPALEDIDVAETSAPVGGLVEAAKVAASGAETSLAAETRSRAVEALLALPPSDIDDTSLGWLREVGELASSAADWPSAKRVWERVVEVSDASLPEEDPRVQADRSALARALAMLEDFRGASRLEESILATLTRTLPADHRDLQAARLNHANTLSKLGDLKGACDLEQAVIESLVASVAPNDHDLAIARLNHASTLRQLGQYSAARSLLETVVEVLSQSLSDEHSEVQTARLQLSATLCELGDFPAARRLLENVLAARIRTLPPESPELSSVRASLAVVMSSMGDLKGARVLEEEVLRTLEATVPDDAPVLQKVRQNLAATLFELGERELARDLLTKVLEIRSRTLSEDSRDLQTTRLNLAVILRDMGELRAARDLLHQVVAAFERILPAEHPHTLTAKQALAVTQRELGEVAAAHELETQLLEVRTRTLPEDHPHLNAARLNLAGTLFVLGEFTAARALLERALQSSLKTLPDTDPFVQKCRSNLAAALERLGDRQGARELQERVLDVYSRSYPEDHPELQTVRGNLAATLYMLGEWKAARELQELVLDSLSRTMPDDYPGLQLARSNLATTLLRIGDYQAALELEQSVLEVCLRTLPDDHPELLRARIGLAATTSELGNLDRARELLETSLDSAVGRFGDDHPDILLARRNLAFLLGSLAASSVGGDAGPTAVGDLGALRLEFLSVVAAYQRGLEQAVLHALADSSSREAEERVSSHRAEFGYLMSFTAGLGVFEVDRSAEEAAFLLSEGMRCAALESARRARRASSDPSYQAMRLRLRSASEALARLVRAGATPADFANARNELESAERAIVFTAEGSVGDQRNAIRGSLDELSTRVEAGDAFVAYRVYSRTTIDLRSALREKSVESLCAFVIAHGAPAERIELGPLEPIQRAVSAWREGLGIIEGRGVSVAPSRPGSEVDAPGGVLRRAIFDPLEAALRGASRIGVELDGDLNLVALDALPASVAGETLGDRLRFEFHPTLDEFGAPDVSSATVPRLLGIGDVAYEVGASDPGERPSLLRGGMWSNGFPPLPGTRLELDGIERLFGEAFGPDAARDILRATGASKPRLVELAPSARYAHIATHGWFAPTSMAAGDEAGPLDVHSGLGMRMGGSERIRRMSPMLLCGIALSGANQPEDALGNAAGLATAEELATLDLSACELVVLSACDTNAGVHRAGQGLASLQRALHMAGARSVVTSLWKVPDEATKVLMIEFYRRLWLEKEPKWKALWEAKRSLREARDSSGRPVYSMRDWAAWMLTGDSE